MSDPENTRRRFLKGALIGGAMAGASLPAIAAPLPVADLPAGAASGKHANADADLGVSPAYFFLTPDEAAFVEALVDHMVPADGLSPKGTDIRMNVYFDRTLGGNWGKGDRLYTEGPWKPGLPGQGYQSPLLPCDFFRVGTQSLRDALRTRYGKGFAELNAAQKEEVLHGLEQGQIDFGNGVQSRTYFALLYQLVMEGLFADPVYGGNADKAGWKLVGFPGVVATHTRNIVLFKNKPFAHTPQSMADAS